MKILIVDDEAPARDRLRQMLEDEGEHTVVGVAENGRSALDMGAAFKPDVVLLDIRMPEMSGIEAAHHFNKLEDPPAIVFTTAYDQYAIEAFDAQAIGYVLKPVRRERLARALAQAARLSPAGLDTVAESTGMAEPRRHVCARVQDEIKLIPIDEIVCFVADQKYTRVCYPGGEHLIDDSLKQLETEFADTFVRVHRSALVALSHVNALQKSDDGEVSVRLRGDFEPIKVSRRHVASVRRRLKGVRS